MNQKLVKLGRRTAGGMKAELYTPECADLA